MKMCLYSSAETAIMIMLLLLLMGMQTTAQRTRAPPPRPSSTPMLDDVTLSQRHPERWPAWWWVVAVGAGCVVTVVIISLCVCLFCVIIKRKAPVAVVESADGGHQQGSGPGSFRRMNSSAAKRYLQNVASVFSWGSEFGGESCSHSSAEPYHVYANPQAMALSEVTPPPRPPRDRKSGNQYLNVPAISTPAAGTSFPFH